MSSIGLNSMYLLSVADVSTSVACGRGSCCIRLQFDSREPFLDVFVGVSHGGVVGPSRYLSSVVDLDCSCNNSYCSKLVRNFVVSILFDDVV